MDNTYRVPDDAAWGTWHYFNPPTLQAWTRDEGRWLSLRDKWGHETFEYMTPAQSEVWLAKWREEYFPDESL